MLQLLLERDQSYEDIGSLLGSDVGEIRSRARAALEEMGGADPDAEVSLTDYLLGQADPIGRADAARHLQADPGARDLAAKLATQLKLIAPSADLPEIPAASKNARRGPTDSGKSERPAKAAKPEKSAKSEKSATPAAGAGGSGTALSSSQKRLIGALGAAAAVVLVIVLVVSGAFGGDDGDSPSGRSDTTTAQTEGGEGDEPTNEPAANGQQENTVSADLKPVGDADPQARGAAVFGQVRGSPVLQVFARGLEPSGEGDTYTIWLYRSEDAAFLIGRTRVEETGGIASQVNLPRRLIQTISDGTFPEIDISLTSNADLTAAADESRRTRRLNLRHIGETVLRGPITGPGVATGSAGASGATGPAGAQP